MNKPRRKPVQREKAEQAQIAQLLRSRGAKVYVLGNRRRKGDYQGTMQTPGLQDLQAFLPPRDWNPEALASAPRELVFIECKASGGGGQRAGRASTEQLELRELCHAAGIAHIVGGYNAVVAWLIGRGYASPNQFPHYRLPAESTEQFPSNSSRLRSPSTT